MAENKGGNVRFIRVRGRVIPIRDNGSGRGGNSKQKKRQKALETGAGAATGAVTAAAASGFGLRKASISGSQKIAKRYTDTVNGITKAQGALFQNHRSMIDKSVRAGKWDKASISAIDKQKLAGQIHLDKAFFNAGHKYNGQIAAHAKKFSQGRMRAGILGASLLGAGLGAWAGSRRKDRS